MITQEMVTEFAPHEFSVDASELRLAPGNFPTHLETQLGNKLAFVLTKMDENGTAHYHQPAGCVTLRVFND